MTLNSEKFDLFKSHSLQLIIPALLFLFIGHPAIAAYSCNEALLKKTIHLWQPSLKDRIKRIFLGKTIEEAFDRYLEKKTDILVRDIKNSALVIGASFVRRGSNGECFVLLHGDGPEIKVSEDQIIVPSRFLGYATLPGVFINKNDQKKYFYIGYLKSGHVLIANNENSYIQVDLSDIQVPKGR